MTKIGHMLVAPIALIALIHIIGGVAILAEPRAAMISGLAGPYAVFHSPYLLAILLIAVGSMALYGRAIGNSTQRFAFVLPQQAFLLLQLLGILGPLWHGTYPDGYEPIKGDWAGSVWFILGDQLPLVGLCVSHLMEMVAGGEAVGCLRELKAEKAWSTELERHVAIQGEAAKMKSLFESMNLGPKPTECDDCPVANRE